MNYGARNNSKMEYDTNAILEDFDPDSLQDQMIVNSTLRKTENAVEWMEERGNCGDNIPVASVDNFFHSIKMQCEPSRIVKYCVEILETQMHPTAESIVKDPVKHFIYNACGKRAHNYEIED